MEKNFVHLHLHTEYSLLDGVGKISEYIEKAKELKMRALAITDHGNMFGAIELYQKAISAGIKPIIGIESYLAEFDVKSKEGRNFHLVLLAMNNTGYQNLIKISSYAYTEGFYYKPRVDKEFLKSHSEGVIALSACMQGEISRRILDNEDDGIIKKSILEYIEIFGKENFYLEVQGNGIREQEKLNNRLYDFSEEFGLKLVATNDTHYVNKGDHTLQDILICIQTGAKVSDEKRMRIETDELYFKSRQEMINSLGEKFIQAINNSEEIASRCNLSIEFGKFKFPYYELPENFETSNDYLKSLVYSGLEERYPFGISKEILERAEYELSIINRMGYSEYFIVVWDFINFAKTHNIPIGPGRGSAAGSLVAYSLKITELDPLKYNLIFERFLNPERISMPDIDIDICQERRQELIDYVTKKYGENKVAQIITFGTLKARAAIRDVGRVLDVPISKVDKVAKLIPFNYSIKDSLEEIKEFHDIYESDSQIKKIVDFSKKLENKVRHSSIHAAGIVITKDSLDETIPVYKDKDSVVATQYQMKELEDLGLLKMDFLGLRNLTNIQRTIDYIKENLKEEIVLSEISLDIKEVYEMLSSGDTLGVFQLESLGIRKLLKRLKPDKFEDIIALLALYRPGPLGSGMV
uniref:DNA polymerase III subunit alpha n=1 Tax=Fusobacterium sp. TaxID=68766 RepID=UPI00260E1F12